ncbi:hypothetical protein EDC01DRAFT_789069 [Geopyxis carbonaria]|nr:hypothetical protein EDC01DRAFT_789069 [Geopyxis carbonaria]
MSRVTFGEDAVVSRPRARDHGHERVCCAGQAGFYILKNSETFLEASATSLSDGADVPVLHRRRRQHLRHLSVYGDTYSVNGQILPQLDVEPRKYRFRIRDAAASSTFGFTLTVGWILFPNG